MLHVKSEIFPVQDQFPYLREVVNVFHVHSIFTNSFSLDDNLKSNKGVNSEYFCAYVIARESMSVGINL